MLPLQAARIGRCRCCGVPALSLVRRHPLPAAGGAAACRRLLSPTAIYPQHHRVRRRAGSCPCPPPPTLSSRGGTAYRRLPVPAASHLLHQGARRRAGVRSCSPPLTPCISRCGGVSTPARTHHHPPQAARAASVCWRPLVSAATYPLHLGVPRSIPSIWGCRGSSHAACIRHFEPRDLPAVGGATCQRQPVSTVPTASGWLWWQCLRSGNKSPAATASRTRRAHALGVGGITVGRGACTGSLRRASTFSGFWERVVNC